MKGYTFRTQINIKMINLQEEFPVKPEVLYRAWLDSKQHSNMTGGGAQCSEQLGGTFTAWDDYISGSNKSLKPYEEIVQFWRTTEFEAHHKDSLLTLRFTPTANGCVLNLIHENIPEGQSDYKQGWIEHYFQPMHSYFVKA